MTQSQVDLDRVLEVAQGIGEFIEYWGFKEIHGRIWAYAFLSARSVSAEELWRELGVSKSLVSMSLSDLLKYQVFVESPKQDGLKRYQPNSDLFGVISNVLKQREAKMIQRILKSVQALERAPLKDFSALQKERIQSLKSMTEGADEWLTHLFADEGALMNPLGQILAELPSE